VLRLHVDLELTDRTIVTCPPDEPPAVLAGLVSVPGVRSLDLHRYRVRLNLSPDAIADSVAAAASPVLAAALGGDAEHMHADAGPRAFESGVEGPRLVAESAEMAERAGDARLSAVFRVDGVVEAIAAPGLVLVRLGRLFAWEEDITASVAEALAGR
jgi:hypothetical protein